MSDSFQMPETPESTPFSWRPVAFILSILAVMALVTWGMSDSAEEKKKKADIAALEQTLTTKEAALAAQKDKVTTLTTQLEQMKSQIQIGGNKNQSELVKNYNLMAAQQRAERDKYLSMVADYQANVEQLKDLQ